ncbi:hypothetical protein GQ53DRAFT_826939 [Thozetella sp. PMI_491]|nr:hypothetical protein GQ53DRAFT_826939 [Thozetella sp. PMI_491]
MTSGTRVGMEVRWALSETRSVLIMIEAGCPHDKQVSPKTAMWGAFLTYSLLSTTLPRAAAHSEPIPIKGVLTGIDINTGQRPSRQNINDLYSRGDTQWDLYVLSLASLQEADESEELSYF